jgi:alpha/beta hydrolase family protein
MNPSTSHRISFRDTAIAIVVFVLGLVLILSVRAQGSESQSPGMAADTPKGPGSVSGAPYLPTGSADTFTSHYVDIGGLRLHAVIEGKGRPLLLVHGWPQTWYQWRLVMPALARDFQVIAVDQFLRSAAEKDSVKGQRAR